MNSFIETLAMRKQKIRESVFKLNKSLLFLAVTILIISITGNSKAKSLYLLADIRTNPSLIQAYDVGIDGFLTFQDQYPVQRRGLGAIGIAVDSDYGYLFITNKYSEKILVLDAKTMITKEVVNIDGASNLAGTVYDHDKGLLYCVERKTNKLFVLNWDPKTLTLTQLSESPVILENATAYGIALDEIDGVLYVANGTRKINMYSTTDWSLIDNITVNIETITIALDVLNGFLYCGGGLESYEGFFETDNYFAQCQVVTGEITREICIEPSDAQIMGIAVDQGTGFVYVSSRKNIVSGGDQLLEYDNDLNLIDTIATPQSPSGLVIPGKEVGYNPLNVSKNIVDVTSSGDDNEGVESVDAGDYVTYRISLNNNDYAVTDLSIVDTLPAEVNFYLADDHDGKIGKYDIDTHTFTWNYTELPIESDFFVEIMVQVNEDVPQGTPITNFVTVNSNETPKTTTSVNVVTATNPLNISMSIVGGAKWIDVNETFTYHIYLDNNDNNFPVTNVTIEDRLPEDVNVVSADLEEFYDIYEINGQQIVKWNNLPPMLPGDSLDLELTVLVDPNTADDTILTNFVTVSSRETPPSYASIDIKVGEPLEVDMQVVPETIRRGGGDVSGVMVILAFPKSIDVDDIAKDELLVLSSEDQGEDRVQANDDQNVISWEGTTYLIAVFDITQTLNAISGYGQKNIVVEGSFINEQPFIGKGTITITRFGVSY